MVKLKDLYDEMNRRKANQIEEKKDFFEGFDKGYGSSPSSGKNPQNLAINAESSDESDSEFQLQNKNIFNLIQKEDPLQAKNGSPKHSKTKTKIIYDLEQEDSSTSERKKRKISADDMALKSHDSLADTLDDAAEKMKEIGDGIMSETNLKEEDAELMFYKNLQSHQDSGNQLSFGKHRRSTRARYLPRASFKK